MRNLSLSLPSSSELSEVWAFCRSRGRFLGLFAGVGAAGRDGFQFGFFFFKFYF